MKTKITYLDSIESLKSILDNYNKDNIFFIVDRVIYDILLKLNIFNFKNNYIINNPEKDKTFKTVEFIINKLVEATFLKDVTICAIGGGATLDIAGFVGSTYLRGVKVINIPTTLLAMVDASIGGKNAINNTYKNVVGTIKQPEEIIICSEFLKSLPTNEYNNGMAEIIKIFLLRDKKSFFELYNTKKLTDALLKKAIKLKVDIIEEDPNEEGIRYLLNFGHTFGHLIEKESNFKISHGVAVANGMMLMLMYQHKYNFKHNTEIINLLKILLIYFNLYNDDIINNFSYYEDKLFSFDKKNTTDFKRIILLEDYAKPIIHKLYNKELELEISKPILQRQILNYAYQLDLDMLLNIKKIVRYEDLLVLTNSCIRILSNKKTINVKDSAFSLRTIIPFIIFYATAYKITDKYVIKFSKQLSKRPNETIKELFEINNIKYTFNTNSLSFYPSPINTSLIPIENSQYFTSLLYSSRSKSSQYFTSLLYYYSYSNLKLPLVLDPNSTPSFSYILLSVHFLQNQSFEYEIVVDKKINYWKIILKDRHEVESKPLDMSVDFAYAANFIVLSMLYKTINYNKTIINNHHNTNLYLSDPNYEIINIFKDNIEIVENGFIINKIKIIKPLELDLKNYLDLGPILFVYAMFSPSTSIFRGYENLVYKESDRLNNMIKELKKINPDISIENDRLYITGKEQYQNKEVIFDDYNDHRLYYALSVLIKLIGFGKIVRSNSYKKSSHSFNKILRSFK